jgi:hypothetical protein
MRSANGTTTNRQPTHKIMDTPTEEGLQKQTNRLWAPQISRRHPRHLFSEIEQSKLEIVLTIDRVSVQLSHWLQ